MKLYHILYFEGGWSVGEFKLQEGYHVFAFSPPFPLQKSAVKYATYLAKTNASQILIYSKSGKAKLLTPQPHETI